MSLQQIAGIELEVIPKKIKNLNLRILPPDGKVVVSVPKGMSAGVLSDFIFSKKDWIEKQQTRIKEKDFDNAKEYLSGEDHYLFGKKYILDLKQAKTKEGVSLNEQTIILYCKDLSDRLRKEALMDKWYKLNLERNLPELLDKWAKVIGVSVNECRVRKMHTRWGTCNTRARRIWISLMLAKRRPELVEYIVVHEMVHLLEHGHNKRFYSYMDKFLPGWKQLRKELK